MRPKLLLGLTTITKSDWQKKVKEIDELGLKEIALFPTCLRIQERRRLYKLLEKTGLKKIPFVHVRHDFQKWEFAYLEKRFGAKVFNTHFDKVNDSFIARSRKYLKRIYLENNRPLSDNLIPLLDIFAGLCLDISHWEDYGRIQKIASFKKMPKLLKKYKVGCGHISAMRKTPFYLKEKEGRMAYYNSHWLKDLSELDYVKRYVKYLPPICAIELENPLKRQMEAKKYLEEIING
ncbi:MAG: hypothetical protein PHR36_02910 [Patescibacteria group bacterium]|nr:hypothetical protein [Patescibacteria group bacterium]